MWALLKNRNFRLLWMGQLSSVCSDRLTQLLLVALASLRASGSTMTTAKFLVMTSLPALLVGPFAGAYVDRWDRKRTMVVCDVTRVGLILALPWLALGENILALYAGVFLMFSLSAFFIPARLAMIPDVVDRGRYPNANALFTTSGMIGSALVLLVGAFWVEWFGVFRASAATATGYVASALLVGGIVRRKAKRRRPAESARTILLQEMLDGVRALWRHRTTRWIIALLGFLMGGAGVGIVVGTVLVQEVLGSLTRDLGFLSFWAGAGMVVSALTHNRWAGRWRPVTVLGSAFLGCGVSAGLFVWAVVGLRSGAAAAAASAVLGFWVVPAGIAANTLVHRAHPERFHGRIFSSLGAVVNVSLIVAMLAGGALADRWGGARTLLVLSACFALGGAALLYYAGRKEKVS